MLRLVVPILPEHIWKDIDEKEVSTFDNEKNAVGSGPFVLAERSTGQFVRLTANKSYWGGAPKIDEVVFRVFNNADAELQALKKGRSTSPTGSTRRPSTPSRTPRASPPWPATMAASTSSPSTPEPRSTAASRSGRPPRPQGQAGPAGHRPRRRQAGPGRPGAERLRHPGHRDHPRPLPEPDLPAGRRGGLQLRSGRGQPAPRRGRLQGHRRRQGQGDARRQPAAQVPPVHQAGVQHLPAVGAVHPGLAARHRHRHRRQGGGGEPPDRDHRPGRVRHVRVGLGGRARPRLPARPSPAARAATSRAATSWPTCPTASTATPPTTSCTSSRRSPSTRPSGPRSSSRCRGCCTTTRPTSSPSTTTSSRPTAATALPAICPSPTRGRAAVPDVRHLQLPQHHHPAGGRGQQ